MPTKQSEAQIHRAVLKWWALACRGLGVKEFLLMHTPNGGRRDIITAAQLKGMGVRAGWPDLFLAVPRQKEVRIGKETAVIPRGGLFLELKAPAGRLSPAQLELVGELQRQGYAVHIAWSFDEAVSAITNYLNTGDPLWRGGGK